MASLDRRFLRLFHAIVLGCLLLLLSLFFLQSKAFVGNKGILGAGNAAFAGIAAGIAVAAIAIGVFLSKDKTPGVLSS